jgi:hypothetical protein
MKKMENTRNMRRWTSVWDTEEIESSELKLKMLKRNLKYNFTFLPPKILQPKTPIDHQKVS